MVPSGNGGNHFHTPGHCLGALWWNDPVEMQHFLLTVPFTKETLDCPHKSKVSGMYQIQYLTPVKM